MHRRTRTGAVATAAAIALGGLVAASSDSALAAREAAPAAGVTTLNVVATDNNTYVAGPTTFPAGRVRVNVDNAKSKGHVTIGIVRLDAGYTWKNFRHDLKVAFTNLFAPNGDKQKGLKALNHAIDNTSSYGGFSSVGAGSTRHGAILLSEPGDRYYIFNDTSLPRQKTRLTVTPNVGNPSTLPKSGGTVIAKTNRRFGGDKVLPAKGNIRFLNTSTESPHFLVLQHVKNGTTRKQVRQSLQSNKQPDFLLPGERETDVISLNQQMTEHVNLPKGEYVELCFFPDPKTGMPHAFMGMIHIVHLK